MTRIARHPSGSVRALLVLSFGAFCTSACMDTQSTSLGRHRAMAPDQPADPSDDAQSEDDDSSEPTPPDGPPPEDEVDAALGPTMSAEDAGTAAIEDASTDARVRDAGRDAGADAATRDASIPPLCRIEPWHCN